MCFILFNILVYFSGMLHPIHVSVCNLDFNENNGTLSVKLFKDDFAVVLENNYHVTVDMELATEKDNSQIINKYINSCLSFELDNKKRSELIFTKTEVNDEAIWLYFRIENSSGSKKLIISNKLMLDLFEDQTNLLIMNYKGKEKGYMFNRKDVAIEINLTTWNE